MTGTTGTGTGSASTTETVVELATLGELDSVTRGDAGVGAATVDGADDVCAGATPVRGRRTRVRARCRLGSGEACGSLGTEPETVSACP